MTVFYQTILLKIYYNYVVDKLPNIGKLLKTTICRNCLKTMNRKSYHCYSFFYQKYS